MTSFDLFRIYFDNWHLGVDVNTFVIAGIALICLISFLIKGKNSFSEFWLPEVQLSVPLGGFGSVSIKADYTISQIAYTAWAELITRKAGLPIEIEDDVISEIYTSWYQLFGRMRELIKTIPAYQLRKENTKKLVRLLIDSLNKGLRPHLTKWQARFNKWYQNELTKEENKLKSPQEIQKNYPEYKELIADLIVINQQMVSYASELKKLVKLD